MGSLGGGTRHIGLAATWMYCNLFRKQIWKEEQAVRYPPVWNSRPHRSSIYPNPHATNSTMGGSSTLVRPLYWDQ